jgi:hypothetical protein
MASNNSLNSSLNLTSLDFFGLKSSFANYLRGQEQFKDYDFEGSALSVLLDELAYNTYKNAFLTNMLFSEAFIDSSQLRSSIFSHAKELNYLPRSTRSAVATVNVSFTATGTSQPYTIEKGSQFSTLIKSTAYTFSIPETLIVASANSTFSFQTDIYEGVYLKDSYIFTSTSNPRFKITNENVDTTSVSVAVYEDGDQVGQVYTLTNTLLDLTDQSKIFFIQTNEIGGYEIYFGDNVLGRQPKLNSTIVIDYRVSAGSAGNGAKIFSVDFDPTGTNEVTSTPIATTIEYAKNGNEAETNDSIKYYAPRSFQVQERTVTTNDYEVALKQQFPEIDSVAVYGGETVDPPQFGRVFVAISITGVDGLPDSKKTEYYNFLKARSPLSITPVLVSPVYTYLKITSLVRYNLNVTTNSSNRISTLATGAIVDYNTANLNDFNVTLRLSQLANKIDNADLSIVSNITDVACYKRTTPVRGIAQNIIVNFNLPIDNTLPLEGDSFLSAKRKSVYSDTFKYAGSTCILEDDGNGIMRILKFNGSDLVKVLNIGTVDYTTGTITLTNFAPDDYDGTYFNIFMIPADRDVQATQNNILTIDPSAIAITVGGLRL